MRSKTLPHGELRSFLAGVVERGEEVVNLLLEDLLANQGVRDQLGKTAGRAAEAKKRVDGNMQAVLSLLNLPSRTDYQRLATKVDALHGSLVNVNMKLDRLLAGEPSRFQQPAMPRRRPARTRKAVVGGPRRSKPSKG